MSFAHARPVRAVPGRILAVVVLAAATLLTAAPKAHAYPSSPSLLDGLTTRDGGGGCQGCHNSPNLSNLTVSILSAPAKMIVGTSANLTVRASSTDGDASGLHMGVVIAAGGPSSPY